MTHLSNLPNMGSSSLELLEAAGFSDAESLTKVGVDALTEELQRANSILKIAGDTPDRARVEQWVLAARELTGADGAITVHETVWVNHEILPEIIAKLENAPFAIPLPVKVLIDKQLVVNDIPSAMLLSHYSGELELRADDRSSAAKPERPAAFSSQVKMADTAVSRVEMDTTRIKSTDEFTGDGPRLIISEAARNDERLALIRGPLEETNRGRDPNSRRYIRGVLHSYPISLSVGAVVTLILVFALPVGIVSAALLLLSSELPEKFGWVPKWLLVFPISLPVLSVAWLIWGMSGSCRICGQKAFVPRRCLKNSKAHHLTGLGYIIPVAIHMLLFKWFRCSYCGTPVRLKK
jgi:Domain of unknown function (DUF4332)